MASMVLPTPGGPMKSTLVASSKNRRVASSPISFLSTDGWAEKSKSASVQGAGRQAKRSRPGPPPGLGGHHLDIQQTREELGVTESFLAGVLELPGQGLGGGAEAQIGQVAADLLIDGGLGHRPPPAISS